MAWQRTVRHQNLAITGLAGSDSHMPAASLQRRQGMSKLRLSFLLPLLAFAVLALVGAAALYSTLSGSRDPTQLPSVLVGKPAPQTTLQRLRQRDHNNENSVTMTEFRGQPLLVNFFASWCAPCRAEAPALEMLSKRYCYFWHCL